MRNTKVYLGKYMGYVLYKERSPLGTIYRGVCSHLGCSDIISSSMRLLILEIRVARRFYLHM